MGLALEDQLLIQCSRINMNDLAVKKAVKLLDKELDWSYILETSIKHNVSPLFYHGLKQVLQSGELDTLLPQPVMEELEKLYHGNRKRNLRLYRAIGDVCKAFERVGITAMGLKDFQLTWELYPDVGLRPMGDIDILIHPQDYDQAIACMLDQGFNLLPYPDLPFGKKYAWAHDLQHLDKNVWIDLQWGVMQLEWDIAGEGSFYFDSEKMWQNAQLMTVQDYQIYVPKLEDMLFHLCIHLEGHRYAELVLFCDIAEFIRQYGAGLDWDYLFDLARKHNAQSSIYYVLLVTHKLFGCSLPSSFESIRPDYFKANLFAPLFGNLVTLHDFLDELYNTTFSPTSVMSQFETVTRRQAACAMRLYKEIDQLVTTFKERGARIGIVEGRPSPRVFPSQALEPFADIQLFVLEQDVERLRQALLSSGFEVDRSLFTLFEKAYTFKSADPATGHQPLKLDIQARMVMGLSSLADMPVNRWSKKSQALKALKGATSFEKDGGDALVPLGLVILDPSEMLVYMAGQSGKREFERLFALRNLVEFFQQYQDPIDWAEVARLARVYGLSRHVYLGLLAFNEFSSSPISAQNLALLETQAAPPFILQWARYGPGALDRYTSFKELFSHAFTFFSIPGFTEKLKYMFAPLPYPGRVIVDGLTRSVRLFVELLTARFRTQPSLSIKDFAYWIEPDSGSQPVD